MELLPRERRSYERVVARIQEQSSALPAALRGQALPALARLVCGEFSQIATLLPWWLAELAPLGEELCEALAVASLYGWWYGRLLDDVLDGSADPAVLPLAQHALTRALDAYAQLGLLGSTLWGDLAARLDAAAAAYAEEVSARPVDPGSVGDAELAVWTMDLLMDRAAPLGLTVTAHLHLAGVPAGDCRREELTQALRCLAGARQIADDARDWLADLRAGQLNWASAGLIRDFRARHGPAAAATLERLAGYELRSEGYWARLERGYGSLAGQALRCLAPYGPCRLGELVAVQQGDDTSLFAAMRERRAHLRALFQLAPCPD